MMLQRVTNLLVDALCYPFIQDTLPVFLHDLRRVFCTGSPVNCSDHAPE